MITSEQFKEICERIEAGEQLSTEDAKSLVEVIVALDQNSVLLQNALVLAFDNARVLVESLSEGILQRTGRTEKKIRNSVAKMAANAMARYEIALQMFLSGVLTGDEEQNSQLVDQAMAAIVDEDKEETE
jgi:hypothetical protein